MIPPDGADELKMDALPLLPAVRNVEFSVAAIADATDSAIEDKGHKFVVCTRLRSKWKQSRTDAPTELLLVAMDVTIVHLFRFVSYFSTELRDDEPSLPPIAYKNPSTSTTS